MNWTPNDSKKEQGSFYIYKSTNKESHYTSVSWIILNWVCRHPHVSSAPPRSPWLPVAVPGAILLIPLLSICRQLRVTETILPVVQSRNRGLFLSAIFQTPGYGHVVLLWSQSVLPCLHVVTSQQLITTWAELKADFKILRQHYFTMEENASAFHLRRISRWYCVAIKTCCKRTKASIFIIS